MNIWRHLYDPNTDTHYTNGGYLDENAQPVVDGWQWVEGYAPEGSSPYQGPQPLSTRLEGIITQAGQALAADQSPSVERVRLVRQIMALDAELSKLAARFGGDTPLYREAAKDALTQLGALPDDLEPVRQAMRAECDK